MTGLRDPMYSHEIAARLGVKLDTFRRNRGKYHMIDGMPRPLTKTGRAVWDRSTMEAWFTRHHPARPHLPANDPEPTLVPGSDAEWNARLRQIYGQAADAS